MKYVNCHNNLMSKVLCDIPANSIFMSTKIFKMFHCLLTTSYMSKWL